MGPANLPWGTWFVLLVLYVICYGMLGRYLYDVSRSDKT